MTASLSRFPFRCRSFRRVMRACLPAALSTGLVAAALFGAICAGSPALAQEADLRNLVERVDRVQRELNTLQRQIYRGEPPPVPEAGPAADLGDVPSTVAARIDLRLSQFESQLRALTGQVEELSFRQSQLVERTDRLAADVELRLQRLEQGAQPLAGGLAAPTGSPTPTLGRGQPETTGATPGVIGTISRDDLAALRSAPVQQAAPAPAAAEQTAGLASPMAGATPEKQYEHAFSLLSQANYGEAERALRAFVSENSEHPLAGNAKYWLGETYYVRQDYQQAAITFAEAYQEYPENPKAADNLLKLGMALAALGSTSDACGTFAELLRRYGAAPATVVQRAKQEQQRLACP